MPDEAKHNPYAAPESTDTMRAPSSESLGDYSAMEQELTRIRFWARLVGGFSGVLGMAVLLLLFLMLVISGWKLLPALVLFGVICALFALGSLLVGVTLLRYGQLITKFFARPIQPMYEKTLACQRDVWRILGVFSVGFLFVIFW
jgi:predicted lipid-binding transport protein (Tim44 family)